jgi:hypothetical protein
MKLAQLLFFIPVSLISSGFLFAQQHTVSAGKSAGAITIEQKVPGNIFYENEPKEFIIQTTGDSIEWTCYDFWNKEILSGKTAVTAQSTLIKIEPQVLGWFKLLIRSKQNGDTIASKETSFAIVSQFDLSKVDESAFIGQTHSWQSAEILIPIAKKMGVKYVRDAIRWDAVEKQKQVYQFDAKSDRFISLLAINNLKPYLVCALYNPLYDKGLAPVSAEARLGFANYTRQLLARYPAVEHIEVWNEPDIGTFSKGLNTEDQKTAFYFNLLKTTYAQIHPAFPKVKVIGMVLSDLVTDEFIGKILKEGTENLMDEYAFHTYIAVPESIVLDIDRHKHALKKYNNGRLIPLNLSETGFTTFTFTEKEQADNLPRRIVTALANGIRKIGIYNLQNKSTTHDSEGEFGLIRNQDDTLGAYTPKPAFVTYAALTRQLSGAAFVEEEQVSPGLIYSYKFKKDQEEVRVMYSLSGTGVELYPLTGSLEVVDIMGNSQTYNPVNGVVSLTLNANPVYVKGNLKAPFAKELIMKPAAPVRLKYGFYFGGYTEYPKNHEEVKLPDSIAAGKWIPAIKEVKGHDGKRSRVIAKPTPQAKATWKAAITVAGTYNISAYLPGNAASNVNSSPNAVYEIFIAGKKVKTVQADQFKNQGKWLDLGTYNLSRGTDNYVELSDGNPAHNQPLRADVLTYKLIN